jgi:tetratricopeptide (TPR) repeat protein
MYKSRLKSWGFHKNVSEKDWQAAAVMREKRQIEGIETIAFKIHGRTKTVRDLDQHIAVRCRTSVQEFVATAQAEGITASSSIQCVSPIDAESEESRPSSGSSAGQPPSSSSYTIGAAPKWTPSSGSTGSQPQRQNIQIQLGYVEMPPTEYLKPTSHSMVPVLAAAMPNLTQETSGERGGNGIYGANDYEGQQSDCDYIQQELGMMTALTYRPDAVRAAFPGLQDSDGWELVSKPEPTAEPKLCPKCQHPCRGHSPLPKIVLHSSSSEFGQMLHYQPLPPELTPLPGSEKAATYKACCYAACIYGGQEKFELLAKSLKQGDETFEEMIRENNPLVLLSVLLALTVLHAHNRGTMAASIIRSAYNVINEILGEYNPMTLTMEWLTYAAGQKLADCRIKASQLREVKMAMEQTFEPEHPHIIVVTYCLAFQLIRDKAYDEAEEMLVRLVDTCRRKLGQRNLQTVSTLNALGRVQKHQKRYDEAITTLRAALDLHPLGKNHAYQLDSLKELARLYRINGQQDLMEPIYWRVLAGRIKTLGKTHSFTESARLDLVRFLKNTGRWHEVGMEEKVQRLFDEGPLGSDYEAF